VASTVRSLADAGFEVILVEDACCAATQELHDAEIMIMNQIYCKVMSTNETIKLITSQMEKTPQEA
jgi:nicotinamidase-related amidase